MHVFVTGATGFVGSAVVADLLSAGHRVVGLARSEAGAAAVAVAGAEPLLGSLEDLDGLARAAEAADGVIHTGFVHDFARFAECCEIDRRAIETLASAVRRGDRPLVVTSGMMVVASGVATEVDPAVPNSPSYPRVSEAMALAFAADGVRASVVRLPPTVHGDGDHGFVPILVRLAREKGVSAYVEEGANRWSAVHRLDAGRVFRLAMERGAAGACWHAVAEEGVAFRRIAEVIGHRLGVPVVGLDAEAAAAHFGWFAHFAAFEAAASSARTREALGWSPSGPGLLDDLERSDYFV